MRPISRRQCSPRITDRNDAVNTAAKNMPLRLYEPNQPLIDGDRSLEAQSAKISDRMRACEAGFGRSSVKISDTCVFRPLSGVDRQVPRSSILNVGLQSWQLPPLGKFRRPSICLRSWRRDRRAAEIFSQFSTRLGLRQAESVSASASLCGPNG